MKANMQKIFPEEFVLSILSPEQRLDAAIKLSMAAFRDTKLTVNDVEKAVKRVRKKIHAKN